MIYRFLRISSYYKPYINYIRKSVDYKHSTYNDIKNHYIKHKNHYIKYMEKLGNVSDEIIFNDELLQKKWLKEHGSDTKTDPINTLIQQIRKFRPDVIYWHGIDSNIVKHVRSQCHEISLHFTQSGVELPESSKLEPYDFIITCLKPQIEQLSGFGKKAYFIRHGFNVDILNIIGPREKKYNFTFCGSIHNGLNAHNKRAYYLQYLLENTDITVFSSFKNPSRSEVFKKRFKQVIGKRLSQSSALNQLNYNRFNNRLNVWAGEPDIISFDSKNLNNFKDSVFGLSMYRTLAESEVSLNIHIDIASNYAANARMYEITGMGTCMLTDYKSDIKDYFEPDYEILTFKSPEEAEEKYRYIVNNKTEMRKIARNGQKRTLKEHNMENRIIELHRIIEENLSPI